MHNILLQGQLKTTFRYSGKGIETVKEFCLMQINEYWIYIKLNL